MATADTQPSTFLERDDWMRAVCASDLPPVTARVAVRIGLHLNIKSGQCNPGIDKIATGSNISERSAYRQVAALRRAGWIAIRRGGGRERCNEYVLRYPDTALSGFKPLNPDSDDNETLTERVINPDNRWQTKRGTAKRTGAGAKTPAPRERERSRALAVIPGAPAPIGGAPEGLKDRFAVLLAIWKRPHGDENEAAAWKAFVAVCREDPDIADEINASARRWVAAYQHEPDMLKPLWKWLSLNTWKHQPRKKTGAQRRQGLAVQHRTGNYQRRRRAVSKIVPIQPCPGHPLRSLKRFAADADKIVRRYNELNNLPDVAGQKIEAMKTGEQIDELIADAKKAATLNKQDEALLAQCEATRQRFDPESN